MKKQYAQSVEQWLNDRLERDPDPDTADILREVARIQTDHIMSLEGSSDHGISAARILEQASVDPDWQYGKFALPLYLALLEYSESVAYKPDSSVREAVQNFESAQFRILPDEALAVIIHYRLLPTLKADDLL